VRQQRRRSLVLAHQAGVLRPVELRRVAEVEDELLEAVDERQVVGGVDG